MQEYNKTTEVAKHAAVHVLLGLHGKVLGGLSKDTKGLITVRMEKRGDALHVMRSKLSLSAES